jgi:4-hydroxybenzoate polyprenyltransferase
VALAYAAFSAVASSVYVLNDLLDIEGDRRHPRKRRRPFASGELPVTWGPPLIAGLAIGGFALSTATLPWRFSLLLALYLALTLLYSFWLKRKSLIDVLLLAGMYTLRIVAGGEATATPVSEWLMALSLFLFTSLAFAKRYAELSAIGSTSEGVARGRGYLIEDLRFIEVIGPASGYLAVLVLALYIQSPDVRVSYAHPRVLWLVCPLLLYWVGRLWLFALRRRLDEDPIIFALTDKISLTVGALVGLVSLAATIRWPM